MSGYIGTQPVPQATQTRDAFTCTAGQTSFATSGYTPSFLDVYLNGIKLAAADYTASNGSDVVLASGAALNDILEVVAYSSFEVVTDTVTNAGTVLNLDRTGSDGTILDLKKDGSTVGSIGSEGGSGFDAMYVANGDTGLIFQGYANDAIIPFTAASLDKRDAAIDLGYSAGRFKDLYLSGGVYLGGTGSANKLDDYEEGTWTPTYVPSGTNFSSITYNTTFTKGTYIKIGNTVIVRGYVRTEAITAGSASGVVRIGNLPFVSSSGIQIQTDIRSRGSCTGDNFASNAPTITAVDNASSYISLLTNNTQGSGNSHIVVPAASAMATGSAKNVTTFTQVYVTDA
jgi:hypothetical protein